MRAFLAKLRFLTAYTAAHQQSQSHAEAIHAGLTKLAEKKPFSVLTPEDIKRIVPVWSIVPDPRAVAALVVNCVREDNVAAMKDRWFLDQLGKKYRAISKANRKNRGRGNR